MVIAHLLNFKTLIFRLLLGRGLKFERLWLIRVETVEAFMHLNGISGAYGNWIWPAPYFSAKILNNCHPYSTTAGETSGFLA